MFESKKVKSVDLDITKLRLKYINRNFHILLLFTYF